MFQLLVPSYLALTFYYVNPTSIGTNFDSTTEKKGFFVLYGASTAILLLVYLAVLISSIMLYAHFGEGLKHLEFLRKKSKKLGKADPTAIAGALPAVQGILPQDSESDEPTSNNDVFQEIFQNTVWHQQHQGEDSSKLSGSNSAADFCYEAYKRDNNFK